MKINPDLFRLDGKVAMVTGGSRGIGKAICLGLATFGADVGIVGLSPQTAETVKAIERLGRRGYFVQADVADVEGVRSAVSEVERALGGIDILVNNAGVGVTDPAEDVSMDMWHRVLGVNLRGTFFASQAAGRSMIKRGRGGRIINITSVFGIVGSELGASVYHASKGAVINLTRALACEWAKHGILVNSIGPGFIYTDMTAPITEQPALAELLQRRHALGRFGQPEEMVGAVVFLASDASTFVTGENLFVDGGYTAW